MYEDRLNSIKDGSIARQLCASEKININYFGSWCAGWQVSEKIRVTSILSVHISWQVDRQTGHELLREARLSLDLDTYS